METIKRQDFRATHLKQSYEETTFENCDLFRAGFQGANLTKADLSAARNWFIRPDSCLLSKTVFSEDNLRGLPDVLTISVIPHL